MRSSACVRCAKSKVRCDRREPCSTCRRRNKDCNYADDQTSERIRVLESLVRKLGGDPDQALEEAGFSVQKRPRSQPIQNADCEAILVLDGSETSYFETPTWQNWSGKQHLPQVKDDQACSASVANRGRSPIFKHIFHQHGISLSENHPPAEHAEYLWKCYFERVHPALMPFFEREVIDLRSNCSNGQTNFTNQEHAFVFALYLMTIQSLSDEGCLILGESRSDLLIYYQNICEKALLAYDFLSTHDILSIRTLVIYLYALFTANQFNGSWDIIGLVLRKAERLGLHRDGSLLSLSPYETERRRRLWWCIQNMDLASNTVTGATSIHLIGEWDTKLPLNIEDDDITPEMLSPPQERVGITSMSHCLWRYWVIAEQRTLALNGKRLGSSWIVNKNLSPKKRHSVIDKIEETLVERWLRFCDPVKPLDMTILILAKSLINFWRRATTAAVSKELTKEEHQSLVALSVKALDYHASMFNIPYLEPLQWHQRFLFPWSPYTHVVVQILNQTDLADAEKLWAKVASVCQTMPEIDGVHDDHRILYPVSMTVDAWYHLQDLRRKSGLPDETKPIYVTELEARVSKDTSLEGMQNRDMASDNQAESVQAEPFLDTIPGYLQDTLLQTDDWLFWGIPDGDMSTGTKPPIF